MNNSVEKMEKAKVIINKIKFIGSLYIVPSVSKFFTMRNMTLTPLHLKGNHLKYKIKFNLLRAESLSFSLHMLAVRNIRWVNELHCGNCLTISINIKTIQ